MQTKIVSTDIYGPTAWADLVGRPCDFADKSAPNAKSFALERPLKLLLMSDTTIDFLKQKNRKPDEPRFNLEAVLASDIPDYIKSKFDGKQKPEYVARMVVDHKDVSFRHKIRLRGLALDSQVRHIGYALAKTYVDGKWFMDVEYNNVILSYIESTTDYDGVYHTRKVHDWTYYNNGRREKPAITLFSRALPALAHNKCNSWSQAVVCANCYRQHPNVSCLTRGDLAKVYEMVRDNTRDSKMRAMAAAKLECTRSASSLCESCNCFFPNLHDMDAHICMGLGAFEEMMTRVRREMDLEPLKLGKQITIARKEFGDLLCTEHISMEEWRLLIPTDLQKALEDESTTSLFFSEDQLWDVMFAVMRNPVNHVAYFDNGKCKAYYNRRWNTVDERGGVFHLVVSLIEVFVQPCATRERDADVFHAKRLNTAFKCFAHRIPKMITLESLSSMGYSAIGMRFPKPKPRITHIKQRLQAERDQ